MPQNQQTQQQAQGPQPMQWPGGTVRISDDLDAWQSGTDGTLPADDFYPVSLVRGVAPTLDQAQFRYHFGTIGDATQGTFGYRSRLDYQGKFIRIYSTHWSQSHASSWIGYIVSQEHSRQPENAAGDVSGGDQQFTAVGLEWFLTRAMIDSSVVYPSTKIWRHLGFNTGWGDGRDLTYANRGNKDSRGLAFAADEDNREAWTAYDIVKYLLKNHGTTDRTGAASPVRFYLHENAKKYLDWFEPTVQAAGNSVYQVLNEIISPARGLVWWVDWMDGTAADDIEDTAADDAKFYPLINVTSSVPANVELPAAKTLYGADWQATLDDLPAGITFDADPAIRSVLVRQDESRLADQVIVRGAARRAVFTVSPAAGNLEAGWLASEETAYIAAAASEPDYPADATQRKVRNDRFREAQRFERVYQVFQIPTTWDGEVDTDVFACPLFNQGSSTVQGAEAAALPGLRLVRTLPIITGYDYTVATSPTVRDPVGVQGEWQRPFVVVDTGESTHEWRFAHAVNTTDEDTGGERLTSYHMNILAGSPAFQLMPSGGMPHAIAKNHYDPNTAAPSNFAPEIDWETMRATVCAEWDAYCEARWPVSTGSLPADKPLSRVYVNLGDRARFDWLAAGTIYDVQDGELQTVTTAGAIRDDRTLCEQVAKIAHAWYATERGMVQVEYAGLGLRAWRYQWIPAANARGARYGMPIHLGDLIDKVGKDDQDTVHATVSQIAYDFLGGNMTIVAGYADIDFAKLVP